MGKDMDDRSGIELSQLVGRARSPGMLKTLQGDDAVHMSAVPPNAAGVFLGDDHQTHGRVMLLEPARRRHRHHGIAKRIGPRQDDGAWELHFLEALSLCSFSYFSHVA